MAGSVNKVILLGNLGRDPDIKSFSNGGKIANLSLATSRRWKDRNTGEMQERTEWHRVSVQAAGLVSVVEKYVTKGSKIYVEGELATRKWTDSATGIEKYTTEVVIRNFGGTLVLLSANPPRRQPETAAPVPVAGTPPPEDTPF